MRSVILLSIAARRRSRTRCSGARPAAFPTRGTARSSRSRSARIASACHRSRRDMPHTDQPQIRRSDHRGRVQVLHSFEILNRTRQQISAVSEVSDTAIAVETKQSSDTTGLMIVVHTGPIPPPSPLVALADCAYTVLRFEQCFKISKPNPVGSTESLVSSDVAWRSPVLRALLVASQVQILVPVSLGYNSSGVTTALTATPVSIPESARRFTIPN